MSNSSSDPDFVVADGDLSEELTDSDSGSSPRLSLMDRIQRKAKAATGKKKKLASGSSEDNSKKKILLDLNIFWKLDIFTCKVF